MVIELRTRLRGSIRTKEWTVSSIRSRLSRVALASLGIVALLGIPPFFPPATVGAEDSGGHVFLESYGRCAWHPRSSNDAKVCWTTKFGNAYAGNFSPRKVEW